jgi:hypothetical protein
MVDVAQGTRAITPQIQHDLLNFNVIGRYLR